MLCEAQVLSRVEYVMDVLLPSLKQGEWCTLGACLEEKSSLYKYKLAYCIEGYDTSNAFNILMNLILYLKKYFNLLLHLTLLNIRNS